MIAYRHFRHLEKQRTLEYRGIRIDTRLLARTGVLFRLDLMPDALATSQPRHWNKNGKKTENGRGTRVARIDV
jgi:hypothetical protein